MMPRCIIRPGAPNHGPEKTDKSVEYVSMFKVRLPQEKQQLMSLIRSYTTTPQWTYSAFSDVRCYLRS